MPAARRLRTAPACVKVTPTTLVIDGRGNIVSRTHGEADFAKFNRRLEEKLREPA